MRSIASLAALALLLASCAERPSGGGPTRAVWRDSAAHASAFVTVNGVRLNYLDWGGAGPALILIHGFGDSPHVFDDLAPAFTDRYRVVAYARRGHGKSGDQGPYDGATLVEDLRGLMDSLGIGRASLAGWSMGGNEITRMAGTYPDRVDRIVYLDAAYDWSEFGPAFEDFPVAFEPDSAALRGFDTWRQWYLSVWLPDPEVDPMRIEAHMRELVRELPAGGLEPVPSPATTAAIMETSLMADRREYGQVKAPALAIYAATFVSHRAGDSARIAEWESRRVAPFREASKARVRRELGTVEVLDVPGTHMDFIFRSRDQIVAAMRRFLDAPRP